MLEMLREWESLMKGTVPTRTPSVVSCSIVSVTDDATSRLQLGSSRMSVGVRMIEMSVDHIRVGFEPSGSAR